jgi:beta-mannosidase
LFWQLNDSYPAITWSAIDYAKKPKALYYYARRFFAPQTLTVVPHFEHLKAGYRPKIEGLSIVAVNDTANPVTTNLVCTLCDFRGNQVDTIDMPLTVSPFSSSRPLHLPKALALPEKPEQNALHLKMQTNNDVPVENIYFYLPDKYIDWTEPNITQQLIQVEGNKALLVLNSDNIAKDIKIESEHILELSDNFFDLLPGKERQIELRLSDSIQEADIQIKLTNVASVICGSY